MAWNKKSTTNLNKWEIVVLFCSQYYLLVVVVVVVVRLFPNTISTIVFGIVKKKTHTATQIPDDNGMR